MTCIQKVDIICILTTLVFCRLAVFICALVVAHVANSQKPTPGNDHLLSVLDAMHKSHVYNSLPSSEKVLLVELLAAAEVDQITHFIDRVGFSRIAMFLDRKLYKFQFLFYILYAYLNSRFQYI